MSDRPQTILGREESPPFPAPTDEQSGTAMRRGDSDFYKRLGRSGGMKTNARHGRDFYSRIGKRGGARVAQLVALGRRAEAEKEDER